MSNLEKINRSLGNLEGKVDFIISKMEQQDADDRAFDERLRHTEVKSARNSVIGGGVVSVALMFIKEVVTRATSGT
jgi:hypothetical protein